MTLYICPHNDEVKQLIQQMIEKHRWTDSGFDIPMVAQKVDMSKPTHCFSLGISVAAVTRNESTNGKSHVIRYDPYPCLLLPRSSIHKTPFRMCNSIGLIDAGYRGEVKAMVDNTSPYDGEMIYDTGIRMFQICQHNFLPWNKIEIVDELPSPPDDRGSGGFGSTGLQLENHPRT